MPTARFTQGHPSRVSMADDESVLRRVSHAVDPLVTYFVAKSIAIAADVSASLSPSLK